MEVRELHEAMERLTLQESVRTTAVAAVAEPCGAAPRRNGAGGCCCGGGRGRNAEALDDDRRCSRRAPWRHSPLLPKRRRSGEAP